jgi:hypothetical protein
LRSTEVEAKKKIFVLKAEMAGQDPVDMSFNSCGRRHVSIKLTLACTPDKDVEERFEIMAVEMLQACCI